MEGIHPKDHKSDSLRPSWEEYFKDIVLCTARRSPCHRLQVGCLLVKDKRIIATGYNGFLPGAEHRSIVVDDHEQATVHAEQNCIVDCAKRGICTDGATAYITHYSCLNCFKILAASGVKEIFYLNDYKNNHLVEELNKDLKIPIRKL
jgi:dCMP deaminase